METKNLGQHAGKMYLAGPAGQANQITRRVKMSKRYKLESTAWVSEDGSWSYNNQLATFDPEQLTEKQWETVAELPDYERIEYVMAVMDGDDLTEWEG
jgi:hypothetical protein